MTDIFRAFFSGLKEGITDLIDWNKGERELPEDSGDSSWTKYFSNPAWRFYIVKEVTAQITVVLILLIVIREGIGEFRYIPSESMEPTMKVEDKLFVEKISKRFQKQYSRGDIVIFYPPPEANDDEDVIKNDPLSIFARLTGLPFLPQPEAYIKRIIGLPGDKIQVKKHQGVFINGIKLEEPYHEGSHVFLPEYTTDLLEVPEGHYYVLGDNRNYSFDSHYWGFLPAERVIGRAAFLIYRPLNIKPSLENELE